MNRAPLDRSGRGACRVFKNATGMVGARDFRPQSLSNLFRATDVKRIGDDNPLCAAELNKMLFIVGRQRQWIDEHIGPLVCPKETIEVYVERLLKGGPTKNVGSVQAPHSAGF